MTRFDVFRAVAAFSDGAVVRIGTALVLVSCIATGAMLWRAGLWLMGLIS